MTSDKTIDAIFSKPAAGGEGGPVFGGSYGIALRVYSFPSTTEIAGTVTSRPSGINCTNRDSINNGCVAQPRFAIGLPVVLTATPRPGWIFEGWSGSKVPPECVGRTDPCTVLAHLTTTGTVDANFRLASPTPTPTPACRTAPVTISVSAFYGLITWINIQGVIVGAVPPVNEVTVANVPRGVYTLWITTTRAGIRTQTINVGCGANVVRFLG
ncbi:MAG: hypothetical protein HY646_14095 [Acidobacteria bacterium]|nr:hypothetical protein [Acidobacteriota bacterium]